MTTPTAAVVRQARDFLAEDSRRWTQHAYACDDHDTAVDPTSLDALQWCMVGAIAKCAGISGGKDIYDLSTTLSSLAYNAGLLPSGTVIDVNDHGTHPAVLAYMGRLADALEREEAS